MKFSKENIKNVSIVLLSFLFVITCTGKGNYKRKYERQFRNADVAERVFIQSLDSMSCIEDSLRDVIRTIDVELKHECEKNRKLESDNSRLYGIASRKIEVNVGNEER